MAKLTKEEKYIRNRHEEAKKKLMEKIDEITSREPSALTSTQIRFLRARRSYLTGDQLAKFEDVLERDEPETVEDSVEAPVEKDSGLKKQLDQAMKTIANLQKQLKKRDEPKEDGAGEKPSTSKEAEVIEEKEDSDDDVSYRKIQQRAAELGINPVGKSKDELVKLVSQEGAKQRDAKK